MVSTIAMTAWSAVDRKSRDQGNSWGTKTSGRKAEADGQYEQGWDHYAGHNAFCCDSVGFRRRHWCACGCSRHAGLGSAASHRRPQMGWLPGVQIGKNIATNCFRILYQVSKSVVIQLLVTFQLPGVPISSTYAVTHSWWSVVKAVKIQLATLIFPQFLPSTSSSENKQLVSALS